MKKQYLLSQIEEVLAGLDGENYPDDLIETDMDPVVVSSISLYIPQLDLFVKQGVSCIYDTKNKACLPMDGVTILYSEEGMEQNWLLMNRAGIFETVEQWLLDQNKNIHAEDLTCEIILPAI